MEAQVKVIIGDSRDMKEVSDESIDLIVTSPPYWHLKDYNAQGQIGYGQTLHEYLRSLYCVWGNCHRVLRSGRRMCINIGDQFARSVIYGRYKVMPLHAEIIAQCEQFGFDFMGSIIWQKKKTTMNTTGGANVMGSFPYPPNGIVEIDYEFILIFKKRGRSRKPHPDVKEASRLTKEQWKEYFSGHWCFVGARQTNHKAAFPDELPRRLIRMFTFKGDTVLDPFLGSGTTLKAAMELKRNSIGYEVNDSYIDVIKEKIGLVGTLPVAYDNFRIIRQQDCRPIPPAPNYVPRIQDARPQIDPDGFRFSPDRTYTVADVVGPDTLKVDTGLIVRLLGVRVERKEDAVKYLEDKILGKKVYLKFDSGNSAQNGAVPAYVYLKNRIFVNRYLVKSHIASPDTSVHHKFKRKFIQLHKQGDGNA